MDHTAPGPIRVVSLCAGQGRDLHGALAGHPRADDVTALLVELDLANVATARAAFVNRPAIEVREGDASRTDQYAGRVPADIVLACGIFGNITLPDIERTVEFLPAFCAPGADADLDQAPQRTGCGARNLRLVRAGGVRAGVAVGQARGSGGGRPPHGRAGAPTASRAHVHLHRLQASWRLTPSALAYVCRSAWRLTRGGLRAMAADRQSQLSRFGAMIVPSGSPNTSASKPSVALVALGALLQNDLARNGEV